MQGRNRDADIENGLVDTVRKERIGRIERVALFYMYKTTVCKIALGSCYI